MVATVHNVSLPKITVNLAFLCFRFKFLSVWAKANVPPPQSREGLATVPRWFLRPARQSAFFVSLISEHRFFLPLRGNIAQLPSCPHTTHHSSSKLKKSKSHILQRLKWTTAWYRDACGATSVIYHEIHCGPPCGGTTNVTLSWVSGDRHQDHHQHHHCHHRHHHHGLPAYSHQEKSHHEENMSVMIGMECVSDRTEQSLSKSQDWSLGRPLSPSMTLCSHVSRRITKHNIPRGARNTWANNPSASFASETLELGETQVQSKHSGQHTIMSKHWPKKCSQSAMLYKLYTVFTQLEF